MNEEKIIQKLENIENKLTNHNSQFEAINKKLLQHDSQFEITNKKLSDHDSQFDTLAQRMLNHEERLERIENTMATKADIREISITLDKIVGLVEKRDQEVTVMGHQVQLLQDDMNKVKPLVGLPV